MQQATEEFQRLPPEQLKALTALDNASSLRSVLQTFGLCGAAWWLAGEAETVWLQLLLLVFIASRQQALFVLAHDAAHYRLFSVRRWNEVVGRVCGMLTGISLCAYRVVHLQHHKHLFDEQDPDLPLIAGYPKGKKYLLKKCLKDLTGVTAWKTFAYFYGHMAANRSHKHDPMSNTLAPLRQAALAERRWVLIWQVAALALCAYFGVLWQYLLFWVLPALTVLQVFLRLRAVFEHAAPSDKNSVLQAARTNVGPRWLLWLFFPHHVNYHIEHHLYPGIPHYHLPKAHALLRSRGQLDRAEVSTLSDTWRKVTAEPALN